ncbi:MAG: excinuclease ABC subunit UvrC, partial [Candidatus Cloacimonetes bacterium]|nr:excinuclease ABC subunit UvrC [Candidatus Cloacimonadota bacterium]
NATYPELTTSFLAQYYHNKINQLPFKIMVQHEPIDFETINRRLHNKLIVPQRGESFQLLGMAKDNAFNHLETEKLKHLRKSARTIFPVQELKEKLKLRNLPRKMCCFDISTIQGSDTVASMVWFENGKPRKKNYRHYIMKTVVGQDDFASMAEILNRFLAKLEPDSTPDLIVVDGGKGQLSSGWAILKNYSNLEIEMISLAKRIEEVFLPERRESILLPRSSSALRMLVHIRDEAHRFAVTFHRKRRSSRTLTSELDNVPGIGKDKKFMLLNEFGSVEAIRKATPATLTQVQGIGPKTAKAILAHLFKPTTES